jgi:hypothetical protein
MKGGCNINERLVFIRLIEEILLIIYAIEIMRVA